MATTVVMSIGNRPIENLNILSVASKVVNGYTDCWELTCSANIASQIKIGDAVTSSTRKYLVLSKAGSILVVCGGVFGVTLAPSAGAATSSRSFSLMSDWAKASPYDLISSDFIWKGELYKEGTNPNNEWNLTLTIRLINRQCDTTRYFVLCAAQGASAIENFNANNSPVRYDASAGVAITFTGNYTNFVYIENRPAVIDGVPATPDGSSTIFKCFGLQIKKTDKTISTSLSVGSAQGNRHVLPSFDSCIIYNASSSESALPEINNCIFYTDGISVFKKGSFGLKFNSCTVVNVGAAILMCKTSNYAQNNTHAFNNTVFFGFSSLIDNTSKINLAQTTNIATDLASLNFASPASITNVVAADQFISLNPANLDFRLRAGSVLIGAGSLIGNTYSGGIDFLSRPRSPTNPSIGAIESVWTPLNPVVLQSDQTIAKGIARGLQRGIV